jgi:hypothetical protein
MYVNYVPNAALTTVVCEWTQSASVYGIQLLRDVAAPGSVYVTKRTQLSRRYWPRDVGLLYEDRFGVTAKGPLVHREVLTLKRFRPPVPPGQLRGRARWRDPFRSPKGTYSGEMDEMGEIDAPAPSADSYAESISAWAVAFSSASLVLTSVETTNEYAWASCSNFKSLAFRAWSRIAVSSSWAAWSASSLRSAI